VTEPPQLRDPIEIATWLEALSATNGHAGDHKGARALWAAAQLLRARNDADDTDPKIFVCPECSHVFGAEPE
jgi:hypothetical protein